MRDTRFVFFFLAFFGMSIYQVANGDESMGEKAAATGKTVERGVKKGWNRTKEATCMAGDLECTQRKAGNRLKESKEYTLDKVDEVKNNVD